jgi:hypothetical protein
LIDLTGYWVSIVSEDCGFSRMITPPRGDYPNFPMNVRGKEKLRMQWEFRRKMRRPVEQCKSYGAPNVMRNPTRLHITWANDTHAQDRR